MKSNFRKLVRNFFTLSTFTSLDCEPGVFIAEVSGNREKEHVTRVGRLIQIISVMGF